MRLKKIKYLIDDSRGTGGKTRKVTGYAIDWLPVRLCVRKAGERCWKIDHYDTGYGISVDCFTPPASMEATVLYGIEKVAGKIASGAYQTALDAWQKG